MATATPTENEPGCRTVEVISQGHGIPPNELFERTLMRIPRGLSPSHVG